MIRNVVLMRLSAPDDPGAGPLAGPEGEAALDEALGAIARLALPGQLDVRVGRDLGLRPGGWSAAITSDWADEAAYRAYDLDEEHNVHRAAIVALCSEVARVQFEI